MGRSGLAALAQGLCERLGRAGGLPEPDPSLPRHARCVLFSDCYSEPAEVQRAVGALVALGLRGQLVQVVEPGEEEPALSGRLLLQGTEGEAEVLVANAAPVFGAAAPYRQWFAEHRAALVDIARAAGWGFLAHRTDNAPAHALLALYQAMEAV
jgi:hypothetical protein